MLLSSTVIAGRVVSPACRLHRRGGLAALLLLLCTSFLVCSSDAAKIKPRAVDESSKAKEFIKEIDGLDTLQQSVGRGRFGARKLRAKKTKISKRKASENKGKVYHESSNHLNSVETYYDSKDEGIARSSSTCSGDELITFMHDLEQSLKDARLPAIKIHELAGFPRPSGQLEPLPNHEDQFSPCMECSTRKPMEIHWISGSTWCMNYESTIAHTSQGHGRRVQEETPSYQIFASTCVIPGGSFTDSCTTLTFSLSPNIWGYCNLAALCLNSAGSEYNVWNQGLWNAQGDVPQLYTNDNGCLSTDNPSTTWDRTYCSPDPNCTLPQDIPEGCQPSMIALLADNTCALTIDCQDPTSGSFYKSLIMYYQYSTPRYLELTNSTHCIGPPVNATESPYTVSYCRLACAVPSGEWGETDVCTNVQVTPFPRDGMCSLSAICNGVSNLGIYSPNGPPPFLALNQNNCLNGPSEMCFDGSGSGWARQFCISPYENAKCVAPSGSYLDSCRNRMYMGPDINGGCVMQMDCDAPGGRSANTVVFASTYDQAALEFSNNDRGCLTSGANATNPDTYWSRVQCDFNDFTWWQATANWWNELSFTVKATIITIIVINVVVASVATGGTADVAAAEGAEIVDGGLEFTEGFEAAEGEGLEVGGELSADVDLGSGLTEEASMGESSTVCDACEASVARRKLQPDLLAMCESNEYSVEGKHKLIVRNGHIPPSILCQTLCFSETSDHNKLCCSESIFARRFFANSLT